MNTHNGRALQDTTEDPDPTGDNDALLAPNLVRQACNDERTDERARGHRRDDRALGVGPWVAERVLVCIILDGASAAVSSRGEMENTHAEHSGHGRNVQSEEATADTCERADDVRVRRDARAILLGCKVRESAPRRGATMCHATYALSHLEFRLSAREAAVGGSKRRTRSRTTALRPTPAL